MTVGLFITGTDTDVGKTWVTSMIARNLRKQSVRVGVYKPVCSGSQIDAAGQRTWHDIEELHAALGGDIDRARICPQRFDAAVAPPVAARCEGGNVDAAVLRSGAEWWKNRVDILLVEGVGGLLCPMTETELVADLAADLGYPLLVVARADLGTINHTLMTLEVARSRGLNVAGIVLNEVGIAQNDASVASNAEELASRTDVRLLGVVPFGGREIVARDDDAIDFFQLAGVSDAS